MGLGGSAFVALNRPLTTSGQTFIQACTVSTNLLNLLTEIVGEMNQLMSGVSQSQGFTNIETQFGIPTGSGQTVFNSANGALLAIQGTAQNNQIQNLSQQYG
jgi:hypothetical protein